MVTQVGSQTFGIVVDGVFHTEEIVVKPMSTKLRHIDMFSGNTILGDGAVIMIIDPNGIAKALGTSVAASHEIADDNAALRASAAEQLTSLLVFRAGSSQPKAVPLGLVTRLEEIATDKIELSNGRYMVQYREQLMPLVQMAGVNVQTSGAQPILVFADDGRSMGLVVDEIIDIVEEKLHIEVAGGQDGILGSAVIKGQATEVIDVGHFLPMAFADWFSARRCGRRLEISRRNEDTEFKVPLQRLSNVTAELQDGVMKHADAADRQCLAEAAAHRARSLRPNSARRSNWRCTAPTPSSTARCSS